ncbi:hypothetical protein [Leptospira ilyithenensis]|uniref:Uncharacterized protein n=1 Tax=Leptospira ilyithenensis TaxID=2484901 RepID=A0A4R9LNU1_9LEPT|nr:hypothetical protein [Leptospira ilyithenensis]TGN10499.1 hypothetical protein EHS11_09420 [Leptospira ilyithenensis]
MLSYLHSNSMIVSDLFTVFSYNFREMYKVIFFMDLETRQILPFDITAKTSTTGSWRTLSYLFLGKSSLKKPALPLFGSIKLRPFGGRTSYAYLIF